MIDIPFWLFGIGFVGWIIFLGIGASDDTNLLKILLKSILLIILFSWPYLLISLIYFLKDL